MVSAGLYTSRLIKSRLLPWLGNGLFPPNTYYPCEDTLDLIAENVAKDRQLDDIQDMYERSLTTLDADLADSKAEAVDLRIEYVLKDSEFIPSLNPKPMGLQN